MSVDCRSWVPAAVAVIAAAIVALAVCWRLGDAAHPLPLPLPLPVAGAADAPRAAAATDAAVHESTVLPHGGSTLRREAPPPAQAPAAAPPRPRDMQVLRGRVLLDTREPAAGAAVRIGSFVAHAAADGTFALPGAPGTGSLVAIAKGHEPLAVDDVAPLLAAAGGGEIELVLPGPALAIDGWLLSADGPPCAGWKLELRSGTPCGHGGFPELCAEDFAAGGDEAPAAPSGTVHAHLAQRAAGLSTSQSPNLQTIGADGAFRVGGLRRGRSYVLRAWNETTLQVAFSRPILAGTERYWFVVPRPAVRPVRGRVVGGDGVPIAGARVRLTMRVHEANGTASYQTGQNVRTAVDGAFAFEGVPQQDLLLRFDAKDAESAAHELRAGDPAEDLVVRMTRRFTFRYEPLGGPNRADALRVLDAAGAPLRVKAMPAEGPASIGTHFGIGEAPSIELEVGDSAAWVSLLREGREVRRLPIRIAGGGVLRG